MCITAPHTGRGVESMRVDERATHGRHTAVEDVGFRYKDCAEQHAIRGLRCCRAATGWSQWVYGPEGTMFAIFDSRTEDLCGRRWATATPRARSRSRHS